MATSTSTATGLIPTTEAAYLLGVDHQNRLFSGHTLLFYTIGVLVLRAGIRGGED